MVILSTKDSFSNCLSGNQNKDCKSNLLTLTRYHTPLVTTATHNNRIKHLISKEIKVVECETWRVFHDYQISRTSSTGSSWKNMHKFLQWSLNSWRGFRCPTERIPLAAGSVVAPGNWRQMIPASKKNKQTNQTKLQTNKQNLHFCSCGSCPVTPLLGLSSHTQLQVQTGQDVTPWEKNILQVTKPGTTMGRKGAKQPGSSPTPVHNLGFPLPIPQTTWPNLTLLGRADKIATGGGVATGQVTWVLIKETLWKSQISSCPQPTVPESAQRERTASTASFLALGAGLWMKCILLENKNTFWSPFLASAAQAVKANPSALVHISCFRCLRMTHLNTFSATLQTHL